MAAKPGAFAGSGAIATIALIGQPNSGKSTLFNRLTGSQQKVANYAGATVEQRLGVWPTRSGPVQVLDLPGLYELAGAGAEEWIAATALLNLRTDTPPVTAAVVVTDVTTVERGLQLLAEVLALGLPTVVALNMADLAQAEGITVDRSGLATTLGVAVVEISARRGKGIEELEAAVTDLLSASSPRDPTAHLDQPAVAAFLAGAVARFPTRLADLRAKLPNYTPPVGDDPWLREQEAISATAERWSEQYVRREHQARIRTWSQRVDDVVLHPGWGMVIFLAVMFGIFQAVYSWSEPAIGWIESGLAWLGSTLETAIGHTVVGRLLLDAGLYGAGNVVVFLPQIVILFFWIAILEESGYLARVAFLIDRPMRAAGLSGRSFIPLLSSFACAVPGIMAARTIENPRTRLITVLVAPLITCSARLPVYTLLIGAFIPAQTVVGGLSLPGLVLFSLYAAGVGGALLLAKLISANIDRGIPIPMILELPIYRWPDWGNVRHLLWDRAKIFLRRSGTIIFAMSIVLWFLLAFPRNHAAEATLRAAGASEADVAAYRIEHSAAGILGRIIEPVLAPLGYDWKIGISLIASFTAREVMVATLGTIYQVQDADEESTSLRQSLRADPAWDLPTALSVLVWYIFALQCMSTVAVMKRETGGWRWPLFALGTTYGIAYVLALITYQVASRL